MNSSATTPNNPLQDYLSYLRPAQDTTAQQNYVNGLVTNSKLANERALNSGETMGFAGGEAQRVNRNNDLTIESQSRYLNSLQNRDQNNASIAKVQYDDIKSKETALANKEAENTKPFELSPGQQRYTYDTKTKQYKLTAVAPQKATSKGTRLSAPKVTQAQTLKNDINGAVDQLKTIIKSKNFYGVSQDDYDTLTADFQKSHGSKGVKEFQKALNNSGLKLDKVGDGVGGI